MHASLLGARRLRSDPSLSSDARTVPPRAGVLRLLRITALACLGVVLSGSPGLAQTFELVGTRALGMGGAFVAVADDVTGVYWNPAGLATGALFDASVQRTMTSVPVDPGAVAATDGGWRGATTLVGFAIPSLGVSYLRLRFQQAVSPTAATSDSRQHDRPGVTPVSSLAVDQAGVTLLQTIVANLVVGTTLKVARGSFVSSAAASASLLGAFDQVGQLPAGAVTRLDLDVGILAFAGPWRVGLVGRNLREADFAPDDPSGAGRLRRQVRVGAAFTPGFAVNRTAASRAPTTIAVDVDVTRSPVAGADERHVAAGLERWLAGQRVGIRGGVRANTTGDRRPVATAGASVAVRTGLFLEGEYARGNGRAGQQWSVAGRMVF